MRPQQTRVWRKAGRLERDHDRTPDARQREAIRTAQEMHALFAPPAGNVTPIGAARGRRTI